MGSAIEIFVENAQIYNYIFFRLALLCGVVSLVFFGVGAIAMGIEAQEKKSKGMDTGEQMTALDVVGQAARLGAAVYAWPLVLIYTTVKGNKNKVLFI